MVTVFRHNEQLKVMYVGGPNIRKDYHIEEGEEASRFCLLVSNFVMVNVVSFTRALSFPLICNIDLSQLFFVWNCLLFKSAGECKGPLLPRPGL